MALRPFIACGDPHHGFARIYCDACGHDYLLAFSCKTGYFCPSCHQTRVLLNGEWVEVYRQRPLAEYRYLSGREPIEVEISLEAALSVLFDAVVIPNGAVAITTLATQGHAFEFVKDQYRHCKPIVALGAGRELLEKAGVPAELSSGEADPGVLRFSGIHWRSP